MKLLESGKLWPFGVGLAITCVFCFGVITVVVTNKADVQLSDDYMTNYQDADVNVNDYINAKIAFNKNYDVEYITESIGGENPKIQYSVKDKAGNPVNNAKILIAISRPETTKYDQKLQNPKVENGIYTFEDVKFPKEGVWNIIAKVTVGDNYRFYNIKADTRKGVDTKIKEAHEY
jgi:nitrogen fixation protein FixH